MDSRLKSFWQPNSISVEIWRRLERERERNFQGIANEGIKGKGKERFQRG